MGRSRLVAIASPLFSDPVKHGGITPVVLNLAEGIARRGIEVDLLVRYRDGAPSPGVELPERVRIVPMSGRHRVTTSLFLVHYMRERSPDALLAAGHRFNLAAVWASRLAAGSRIFLSVHNTMSREAAQRGMIHRIKRMSTISAFYPWADGIVAVSRGVADDLVSTTSVPETGIRVIHNPIVTSRMLKSSREPVDHSWLQHGAPPVILGVGRLSAQKAFHNLIKAFAEVRKERDCRLIILGEGDERLRLAGLVTKLRLEGFVDMPGFMDNPYAWMARASVFTLSSIYEGFGNVLVEALAVRTPVVSTDCPNGPSEILDGGRYGVLVPPNDPGALARGILDVLSGHKPQGRPEDAIVPYRADAVVARYLEYMGISPSETDGR